MKKIALLGFLSVILVACEPRTPPSEPPKLSQAPEVATDGFLVADAEEIIPLNLDELNRFRVQRPLTEFLKPTENISNPVEQKVIEGNWPEVGAVRWVRLADGHYIIERILENEPQFFKYQIFVFTNDAGRGVEQIVGEQRFTPVEGGTKFEWDYKIKPKRGSITRKVIKGRLEEIDKYISDGLRDFATAAGEAH